MDKVSFKILGEPKPKQSFRFSIGKNKFGKSYVHKYKKEEVKRYEMNLAYDVKHQLPLGFKPFDTAISVKALFVFPPLKSFSKKKLKEIEEGKIFYKTTKPDLTDNLMKGTMDALNGIVFIDDSLISKVESEKIYGLTPRIELEFETIK